MRNRWDTVKRQSKRAKLSWKENVTKYTVALLLILLSATLCASMISAQDKAGGQGNMSEVAAKLEKMSAALQLTPKQKQQVRPILMDEAPKMKALKSDTSLGPMQKAMKMHQIGEDTNTKLQPILTAQQYQKWQQIRDQERQQMMQQKGGR